MVKAKVQLVAYCGLYCGSCGSYTRGRCRGCLDGGGFSSCQVRQCCLERNYRSCAECEEYLECGKLNNFLSKLFGFIFRSNRKANLAGIKAEGRERWAEAAALAGRK